MHITHEEMSSDRRKPERDKEKKLALNIPISAKSKMCEEMVVKGNKASLLKSKCEEDLEISLGKLCISEEPEPLPRLLSDYESETSDDEETEKLESMLTPKCPDKVRDTKKEQQRNQNRPYLVPQNVSPYLQSGGGVIPVPNFHPDLVFFPQQTMEEAYSVDIPKPVEEFEAYEELDLPVRDLMEGLNKEQKQILYSSLDRIIYDTQAPPKKPVVAKGKREESCNSPDSSYGTMSPASVPPSPFSLHSPNPRVEKRNSESDSAGESELSLTESPFQKIPQMVNCIYVPPRQNPRPVYTGPVSVTCFQRPLRPDSVEVNEVGIERPAEDRLKEKKLLKNNVIDMEWERAIYEAKPLLTDGQLSPTESQLKKIDLKMKLIEFIQQGARSRHFYEQLYCRVKLYKKQLKDILNGKELCEQDPLFVAAISLNDTPLVSRFIVDLLSPEDKTEKVEEIFDAGGNSLLHYLAEKGDSHAQVLAELLHSKAFNVNHKNVSSKTALHKAVETHVKTSSLASVKQFVRHGAVMKIQDLYGQTVIHLAVSHPQCDTQLLRALLSSGSAHEAINVVDNDRNTPLHIAAMRNDLSLDKHKELISQLINSKARHDLRNKNERVALALVKEDRKQEMRGILHRKM